MKYFLLSGYQTLPFVIGGTFMILGLYTAQFSLLFFLVGYLFFTPLLTLILNWILNIVIPSSWNRKQVPWLFSSDSEICNLLPSGSDQESSLKTIISPWLSMIAFFVGYIGMNAYSIVNKPIEYPPKADEATKKATDNKAMLRQTQVTAGAIFVGALALFVLIMRTYITGCDSIVGAVLSVGFGFLGVLWYYILAVLSNDRLSDVFGIANRLMTTSALNDAPYACLASD